MDLVTFIGLAGSISSIISLLEVKIHPSTIEMEFWKRARIKGSAESVLAEQVEPSELKRVVADFYAFYQTDSKFLDRITKKCLSPYYDAIDDHGKSDTDLDETRETTRRCVCRNIQMAKKDNSGTFPTEEFKKLWEQFECGML